LGQRFKLLATRNGLSQGVGFIGRDAAGHVLAVFPDLIFEIRTSVLPGMPERRAGRAAEGAVLHALDLFHLLEKLPSFVGEWIHGLE
jgi:hypothetical protein